MPPSVTSAATFALPTFPSYDTRSSLARVESPFHDASPEPQAVPPGDIGSAQITATPGMGTSEQRCGIGSGRIALSRSSRPSGATTSKPSSLRFFVVDNPAKLKDKQQMRENRKHVMNDYLEKERKKPRSTDARVTGTTTTSKRQRGSPQQRQSIDAAAPIDIFNDRQSSVSSRSSSSPPAITQISVLAHGTQHGARSTEASDVSSDLPRTASRRVIRFADDEAPLVRGMSGAFNNTRYLRTSVDEVPNPIDLSYIGSNIQPFDTWPKPADPTLNVEQLKWSCSRKFGSRGITTHWVPLLIKAKHAFLSTICISSSHDDIMMRGVQAPHERMPFGSTDRMKVRGEVIALINHALADPRQQAADATIVSVLHLLNSEIMGCDDTIMRIHQQGLHDMVRKRGGLEQLGLGGELASILTITNYLISALRESEPHPDFIRYAMKRRLAPPNDYRQLPESPVYCRISGFHTVSRALPPEHPTHRLLDTLRLLTNSYVRRSGTALASPLTPIHVNASWEQCTNNVQTCRDRIFATSPADEHPDDFKHTSEKYQFEALRLVGLVYAHALSKDTAFSKAAADLSGSEYPRESKPASFPGKGSSPLDRAQHSHQPEGTTMSWHSMIKSALIRTDLSSCWGHMAGVLFWATIITGACANPESPASVSQSGTKPGSSPAKQAEDEEGRKWLAAVAVRCSIVLGFEHAGPLLESLKRIVGIEQVLAKADAERRGLGQGTRFGSEHGRIREFEGPEMAAIQGFSDFSADFMSACV